MEWDDEMEKQIADSAFLAMIKNMTDILFVKDIHEIYVCVSQSFAQLVGRKDPLEVIGKTDSQLFDDEKIVQRYLNDDQYVLQSGKPLESYIEAFTELDGRQGYCQTSKFPVFDRQGEVIGLYGLSKNITREYKARLNYEQELRALFELPPNALGAVLFDVANWRLIDERINDQRAHEFIRFETMDEFINNCAATVLDDEEVRSFYHGCSKEFFQSMYEDGKRNLSIEYQCQFSEGHSLWVQNEIHLMSDPMNGNLCVIFIVRDIDEEKQAAYALAHAAEWDFLTDVYNRETTMSRIYNFLSREGAGGTHFLFMIDVDNFKLINDTMGHQIGDDALAHIAGAIRKGFQPGDIVGRIGGDEFFALMKEVQDLQVMYHRASKLVQALQYECSDGINSIEISGSVGISCYRGDGKTLEQLYTEADAALYKAKRLGKNRFVFAESMREPQEERGSLNTVNLSTLLENMDAFMFQTELGEEGELEVTYSSRGRFSGKALFTSQKGIQGEMLWGMLLPEDRDFLKVAIREATENGSVLDCSCRVAASRGQVEWWHICGTCLPDQGDGKHRMIHVVTDITKQKKAEAELREKNSIIDFAMRNTDVNLWYYDYKTRECHLTESCQRAHEMLGTEVLEDFPESLFQMGYVREDCVELLRSAYEKLRKIGENVEVDVWFRKADGTGWWCERETISPMVDAGGMVNHGIGIGKNITSEKLLEEKYESFGAYRRLAEKNTRASFRMNLTTGWFGDCISSTQGVRELYPTDSADIFLAMLRSRIVKEEDATFFDQTISRTQLLMAFSNGEALRSIECHFRIEDDSIIWLRITVEMMRNPVTNDVEALLYSFDIDHEKNMQFLVDKLLENDYEFLGIIDVTTGRLMVFGENSDGVGQARNGGIFEEEAERVFGTLILEEYYAEGIRSMASTRVIEELETKEAYTCSFPARELGRTKEGRKQWKFSYLDESKTKILMTRTDITSLYTAEYDPLTGLYNRETFYRRVRLLLDGNPSTKFLLLRFDVDRFKAYNDLYGTQAGDWLLAEAGREARKRTWPANSVFGHLEADHFVGVLPEEEFDVAAWGLGHEQWIRSLAEGYRLTSSVGVYRIVDPAVDVSLMCDRALLALRTVKENYTKKVAWYDDSLREQLIREQALADDMEQALNEEQFVLYFQPLFTYPNGALIGAEALVRWLHPDIGLIPPGEFIPLFEKNGFILKMDGFVWEKCCQYLRRWLDEGDRVVPISVNVSRCNLHDPELCERFRDLVEKYQLPFSLLNLEITESAYMDDPDQLIGIVKQLRTMGFIVEMDDFGAGYSSLNMLKDMPIDILKLDTLFISESENSERAATILSSIIRMAHLLGLSVIAEGVETKAQADSLQSLDCDKMQGYFFGRPMPAEQFELLLRENRHKAPWDCVTI